MAAFSTFAFTGERTNKGSRPISRVLSLDSHSSRLTVADELEQPTRERRGPRHAPLFGLAPGGVYRATRRCPRARCALTAPFHPYHAPRHPGTADPSWNSGLGRCALRAQRQVRSIGGTGVTRPFGGLFSVALVVGSRRPGVTWHPALWSPDFPRDACAPRDCLADSAADFSRSGPSLPDRSASRGLAQRRLPMRA